MAPDVADRCERSGACRSTRSFGRTSCSAHTSRSWRTSSTAQRCTTLVNALKCHERCTPPAVCRQLCLLVECPAWLCTEAVSPQAAAAAAALLLLLLLSACVRMSFSIVSDTSHDATGSDLTTFTKTGPRPDPKVIAHRSPATRGEMLVMPAASALHSLMTCTLLADKSTTCPSKAAAGAGSG